MDVASQRTAEGALKILLISSEFPPETGFGGIGTYVAELAPALAARGHAVTVLSRTLGTSDTDTRVDGVRVVRLFDRQAPAEIWQEPFDARHAQAARAHYDRAYTVALALQSDPTLADVDVIEAADWAGEAALVRLVLPDVPYVVKFHTPAKLVFGWNRSGAPQAFVDALHALETVAVHNALGFTSPSRWLIDPCEELFGLPRGHVAAIPNPFRCGRAVARVASETRSVLYVGRLEARKGVLEAVAPMIHALRTLPDVRWRLAGADTNSAPGNGSMQEALRAQLPADLRGRVDFLGALDRAALAAELARASAVLLPSRHENFPYTCLEAMDAGAAVVASKHGGMAEMIEHGRSGLLVDPREPSTVLDALLRVLEQPLFAEALGVAAARSVRERYSPEVVAPLVERHYRRTIGSLVNA